LATNIGSGSNIQPETNSAPASAEDGVHIRVNIMYALRIFIKKMQQGFISDYIDKQCDLKQIFFPIEPGAA
jgi:hypothetical protein